MTLFLSSIALLVVGYFFYGMLAEKIFGVRPKNVTPAYSRQDGVDFVPLPTWKVFLIQFLNIAGLGPIFGAIMGVMFGPAAFLWIVFGTIFGGAVHDFISAMISLRSGGASLPEITGRELGNVVKQFSRIWTVVLLILVGAVFVVSPASLLAGMTPDWLDKFTWIAIIFIYYMMATLLPIDKLIGNFYPIFGFALLFMAAGLLCVLLFGGMDIPHGMSDGLYSRYTDDTHPVFPMMFVSIACGAISGFHATQSPMMARCLRSEKLARPVFYGAMVAEGFVALIWAAAAITFTQGYKGLADYMAVSGHDAGSLVHDISVGWLGQIGGILAILGVVAAPITTGDTALRSSRLIVADMINLDQRKVVKRLLISLPIFALCFAIMLIDFNILWRYFAWCNQVLAMITLWATTVYLARHGKAFIVTLFPAMFMTAVCISYILYAKAEGFGLDWTVSVVAGSVVALVFMLLFFNFLRKYRRSHPAKKPLMPRQ